MPDIDINTKTAELITKMLNAASGVSVTEPGIYIPDGVAFASGEELLTVGRVIPPTDNTKSTVKELRCSCSRKIILNNMYITRGRSSDSVLLNRCNCGKTLFTPEAYTINSSSKLSPFALSSVEAATREVIRKGLKVGSGEAYMTRPPTLHDAMLLRLMEIKQVNYMGRAVDPDGVNLLVDSDITSIELSYR